jgi:polar amino acid transport system substrate-binding protein
MEVKAGTADAAVLDLTLANAMTGEGTNYSDLKIVDYLGEEEYGVAFRQGSDIRDAVNDIFAEMVADGSLQALADKYGLELAD